MRLLQPKPKDNEEEENARKITNKKKEQRRGKTISWDEFSKFSPDIKYEVGIVKNI